MNDVLKIDGLVFGFGRKRVLDGFDLHVHDGAVTVLLGENGAGKSTLLRLLLGLLRPKEGTVRLFGLDPVRAHRDVLRRVGYVPDVPDVYPWMTAKDLFRFLKPHYPRWNDTLCRDLCERLAVPMRTKMKAMSRGQGMKTMLAAALAPEPELLLLDEPFAGLDPLVREEVLHGIVGALEEGRRTVLCATHELDVASRIADRIAVVKGGKVARHGTVAEVLGEDEPARVPHGLQRVLAEVREEVTA